MFQEMQYLMIIHIKTLSWGTAAVDTPIMTWRDYIELEISFSNAQPATGKFYKLKSEIEKRYLTRNIFSWSSIIFWIGIVISLIAAFL